MWLHLGNETVVNRDEIIGIFDIDNTTISKSTRELLSSAQKENRVINVSMELPKSFVLCLQNDEIYVYISQISPATLLKRSMLYVKTE